MVGMKLLPLTLLLVPILAGCGGRDVQVFRIDDGSILGELSHAGKFVNMVIGIDESSGKVAVIEWGDERSTLKIVTLQPWQVSEQSIDAGRQTGIDGQMGFDFANKCFIYVTKDKITTIALNGVKREYSVPLRKDYGITSNIMPTPEGIFLVSGTPYGDDAGLALHRIAPDGIVQQFFHTNGHVWTVGLCGKNLCLVETPKDKKGNPRLIQIDRVTLARSEHTLKWSDERYTLAGSDLVSLSVDETTLRRIALDSPDTAQEYDVPAEKDCGIYDMAGSQGYIVLMRSNKTNGYHKHLMIDLASGQTKVKAADQYQARVRLLRYAGKGYGVLGD